MQNRLKQFIDYKSITIHNFEIKIGASENQIGKFIKTNTRLRSDIFQKIHDSFPELNLDWLITGRGSMLIDRSPSNSIIGDNNTLAGHDIHIPIPSPTSPDLLAQLHEKDRTIATLANANAQLVQQLLDLTSQKTQKQ